MEISKDVKQRFWSKVDVRGEDECWEWLNATYINGYGAFRFNGKNIRAHRFAMLLDGRDIVGKVVRHSCDNPPCVNSKHLLIGSQKENMLDRVERGHFFTNPRKGESHPNSKFTNADILKINELLDKGMYQKDVAEIYGVHRSTIDRIRNKRAWKHFERR